jgi:hypothetical protein
MTDGSRSDRYIRLALWFLAGALLPRGASHKGAAPILRQPVRNGGTQWSVLPNAHPDAVKSWKRQTGREFVYAWKASKFITHWKRLSANSVNSLELMEDRLSLLGDKAGPVLFQLPPNFQADADRLGNGRRTLSTFEVMARAVATKGTIRGVPWRNGPSASNHGNRKGATCLCSSITIRRALAYRPSTSSFPPVSIRSYRDSRLIVFTARAGPRQPRNSSFLSSSALVARKNCSSSSRARAGR